ncbi:MAG TPA: LuxR family transcriptional regulator [Solirubrobacteraceae bacterium]|nr:LuxR family transcriptional regulator [Solirubrobacteraceae bacterium]
MALVGRQHELESVVSFLDHAAHDGGSLLVLGEPGVGKSALLAAANRAASSKGTRTLSAAGVQFEVAIPFSGLHQILLPLYDALGELRAPHREALNVALGFGEGAEPERLVIANAVLEVLRRAARESPLLVIVDDVPWLDRASAGVLGFLARRLAGSHVGLLAASRTDEPGFFEGAGLPEIEIGPLDDHSAAELLSARFPRLAANVRERLLAEAQGNPLAVLELPAALSGPQRAALDRLPAVLPLTRRLQALFRSRVGELPEPSRRLLLLMALDGAGDVRLLQVAGSLDDGLDALAPAEHARLASFDGSTHRLAFRHPMIGSAVVALSTGAERRSAHALLAKVWADQPDRRVWHLAEATVDPDEQVAALLDVAAGRVLGRGDGVGAVNALVRAAELSPDRGDRARRLAQAAYIGADVTGELQGASQLLADAQRLDPGLTGSLEAAAAASHLLLNGDGDVNTAHRLLVGAIESRRPTAGPNDKALEEALYSLLMVCHYGGKAELWEPFDAMLAQLGPHVPTYLHLSSKTLSDPVRTAAAALPELEAAVDGLANETDPTVIVRIAIACFYLHRLTPCRQALRGVISGGRKHGGIAAAIHAMHLLTSDDIWTGAWDAAQIRIDETLELCRAHGYRYLALPGRYGQSCLAAARGDYETTHVLTQEMIQWAAPRGIRSVQCYAWHAQALAALGRGDFENAYRRAAQISPPGTFTSHVYSALHVPMDLVEAAVRTGRTQEAAAHVAQMRALDIARLSTRLALLAAGSAAIAAPDECASALFDDALATSEAERWPFDLARVRLAYGERLRRARAMTRARVQLTSALETFDALAARPWATRAAAELRATGQVRAPWGDRDSLTPQELEIAKLAASGLSNKQIGDRLYLSHRTVSSHLHRVFPKLGITSRAALRDALSSAAKE